VPHEEVRAAIEHGQELVTGDGKPLTDQEINKAIRAAMSPYQK
jgi:hypothetical protein